MVRKESKFMQWEQKNEASIGHFVAWTLKCATLDGKEAYGNKLSDYSKKILLFLLFGEKGLREADKCTITEVKVWREWKYIDVLAEITLNTKEKYVLCV
jgi:hypothetical protein